MPETVTAFDLNLLGLAEATKKTLSDPEIRIWRRKFEHLPPDLFTRAVDLAVDTCEWFPTPHQFARLVEEALSPDERAIVRGLRQLRGWLAGGMIPANWDAARLARTRAALGLPPPHRDELDYLARTRAAAGLPEADGPYLPEPGTIEGYLLGERADGGALLALAAPGAGR